MVADLLAGAGLRSAFRSRSFAGQLGGARVAGIAPYAGIALQGAVAAARIGVFSIGAYGENYFGIVQFEQVLFELRRHGDLYQSLGVPAQQVG